MPNLFKSLREKGLWRGYIRHVVALTPVLDRMGERGIPVEPATFEQVVAKLTEDFERHLAKMQTLVPGEIKSQKVYKKVPKKKEGCYQTPEGIWIRVLTWKPSNKGLLAYIRFRGHKVPKDIKTGADTTTEMEIARLARSTGDPLYATVIQYRKAQTILKNHVKNWHPAADGRVHTTFYLDPATGQLSSRRPNVQNAPAHDDPEFGGYAKVFRSMVKAKPGHMLLEFDYKAFHVQTLGFEARDDVLMRVGRIDIHSFNTAAFLHLNTIERMLAMSDDEMRAYLGWVRQHHSYTRDAQVKHAFLGYDNGMGYRKLYLKYMEFFESMNEARQLMDLLDGIYAKAKVFRDAICQKAHDQGYLISRHGYIRYFWEVFKWKGGKWTHGDDHEAAMCFYTQNDAHGELKDRILALSERGLDERYGLLNCIHDSLIFECPIDLVDECVYTVKSIMEAPSTVLIDPVVAPGGLSVAVDVKGGPDWSVMKGIT